VRFDEVDFWDFGMELVSLVFGEVFGNPKFKHNFKDPF
jgi:hypothetical protein